MSDFFVKIEVSTHPTSERVEIPIKVGSLNYTDEFNRTLDSGEFATTILDLNKVDDQKVFDILQCGAFVWMANQLRYLINVKKQVKRSLKDNLWTVNVSIISIAYMMQRVVLPKLALTQPISENVPMIKVKDYVTFLCENYRYEYYVDNQKFTIQFANGYTHENIADEMVWVGNPILYEVLDDLFSDMNLAPMLVYRNGQFVIQGLDYQTGTGAVTELFINGIENNNTMENSPNALLLETKNTIGTKPMKETNISLKTDNGIWDISASDLYLPTSYPVNSIKKLVWRGLYRGQSGNNTYDDCYAEIDFTPFVFDKTYYDILGMSPTAYNSEGSAVHPGKFKNTSLYFEKGKNNVNGFGAIPPSAGNRTQYTALIQICRSIGQFAPEQIIKRGRYFLQNGVWVFTPYPTGGEYLQHMILWENNSNPYIRQFLYDIEYETLMDNEVKLVKETVGFGTIPNQQANGYVNLALFYKQQQDLLNRLGNDEYILMAKYDDADDLGDVMRIGQTWLDPNGNELIICQVKYIPFQWHLLACGIATSKYNRIDKDALITTAKRFYEIVSPSDAIERVEQLEEFKFNESGFNEFKAKATQGLVYCLINSEVSENGATVSKSGYIKPNIIEIDADTLLLTARAMDNRFLGMQQAVDNDGNNISQGVFYVSETLGTSNKIKTAFVYYTEPDLTHGVLATLWQRYPAYSSNLQQRMNYFSSNATGGIYYDVMNKKDVREILSFAIFIKKITA